MDTYIYQAERLCGPCGQEVKDDLVNLEEAPVEPDDELNYDSNTFPKGPYDSSFADSDGPDHCGKCGLFLENPLTTEGYEYLREMIYENGGEQNDVIEEWIAYYRDV